MNERELASSQFSGVFTKLEQAWRITPIKLLQSSSSSLLLEVEYESGGVAVLKCMSCHDAILEIEALKHFNGQVSVKIMKADERLGAFLMERLVPGEPLSSLQDDEKSTVIFSSLIERLHRPVKQASSFPTIQSWLKAFERLREHHQGGTGPFDEALIETAEIISSDLVSSMGNQVLLHGDLHHDNILSASREPYLVIDPKGVIGEREYEAGAFMINPMGRLEKVKDLKSVFKNRLTLLAESTGFDESRLLAWSFVHSVLSAIWFFEDGGGKLKRSIYFAKILKSLL